MNSRFNLNMYDYIHRPEGKLFFNRQMFGYIAPKYNFINRVLSFNRDTAWKKQLISDLPSFTAEHAETAEKKQKLNSAYSAVSAVSSYRPDCLDIACGTGDITFRLAVKYPAGKITGIDVTEEMLNLARSNYESPPITTFKGRRATSHPRLRHSPAYDLQGQARAGEPRITFEIGDMCKMRFADESFDIVTGGYALRNAPDLEQAFLEIRRVMKPGATAAFLDFSKSPNRLIQKIQDFLLRFWGGFWGIVLHHNPQLYTYIAASLRQFPNRVALKQLISKLGFINIRSRKHFFGFTETIFFQKL